MDPTEISVTVAFSTVSLFLVLFCIMCAIFDHLRMSRNLEQLRIVVMSMRTSDRYELYLGVNN